MLQIWWLWEVLRSFCRVIRFRVIQKCSVTLIHSPSPTGKGITLSTLPSHKKHPSPVLSPETQGKRVFLVWAERDMCRLLRLGMPWTYPNGKDGFFLPLFPEDRLPHPPRIRMSVFTTGDTIYLEQAASLFFPTDLGSTTLGAESWAQPGITQGGWDQHPQLQGQGASLLQMEGPKPAGIICSAASATIQAPGSSCRIHQFLAGRPPGQGFQRLSSHIATSQKQRKFWNKRPHTESIGLYCFC